MFVYCLCIVFVYLLHFLCSCTNDKRKEDEDGRMPVDEGKNGRQRCDPEDCSQSEHLWISVKIKSKYLKVKGARECLGVYLSKIKIKSKCLVLYSEITTTITGE